jgi:hypothetical protein
MVQKGSMIPTNFNGLFFMPDFHQMMNYPVPLIEYNTIFLEKIDYLFENY